MVGWVRENYPDALPRTRVTMVDEVRGTKASKK